MRVERLALAALGALALGSAVLVALDWWLARLAGVLLLFAAVIAGVFAIANPADLVDDGQEDATP